MFEKHIVSQWRFGPLKIKIIIIVLSKFKDKKIIFDREHFRRISLELDSKTFVVPIKL